MAEGEAGTSEGLLELLEKASETDIEILEAKIHQKEAELDALLDVKNKEIRAYRQVLNLLKIKVRGEDSMAKVRQARKPRAPKIQTTDPESAPATPSHVPTKPRFAIDSPSDSHLAATQVPVTTFPLEKSKPSVTDKYRKEALEELSKGPRRRAELLEDLGIPLGSSTAVFSHPWFMLGTSGSLELTVAGRKEAIRLGFE